MIEIEFNHDEITPALQRVAAGLADMKPVMLDIGEAWLKSTHERVLRGEQPDGQPFAPRSPTTLERYAARGFTFGGPLRDSGLMIGQFFFEAGPDHVRIGSPVDQAAVMQFGASQGEFGRTSRGGPIPWGDIPARPYLGVSDEDETMIIEELSEWLMRLAEGKS